MIQQMKMKEANVFLCTIMVDFFYVQSWWIFFMYNHFLYLVNLNRKIIIVIILCCLGGRTIGMRTIGMQTIGMEDNWHAENWHGEQLALTFLIVSYLITLMF